MGGTVSYGVSAPAEHQEVFRSSLEFAATIKALETAFARYAGQEELGRDLARVCHQIAQSVN